MIKAVTITLALTLFLSLCSACLAQQANGEDAAIGEVIRRQAGRVTLRQKLADAAVAEQRRDLVAASKLYSEAWDLVLMIGIGSVPIEADQTRVGLVAVRLELAQNAEHRGDYREADQQLVEILRVDPKNAAALDLKALNDKMIAQTKMPSPEAELRARAIVAERRTNDTRIQDGKLLFEMGKVDEAEVKLKLALRDDPQNQAAAYYLNLIAESRYKDAERRKVTVEKKSLVDIEQEWSSTSRRDLLPVPNPYLKEARLPHTSRGRQLIYSKLERIRLDNVKYEGLPLSEVIQTLNDEAKRRDPDKKGINFIINPNVDTGAAQAVPGAVDPATGLPTAAAPPEPVDLGQVLVKIVPPLTDISMGELLDAIIKVADKRIKYSVEDYAVVFSLKGAEPSPIYTRIIKVDPNTFIQGLESVADRKSVV